MKMTKKFLIVFFSTIGFLFIVGVLCGLWLNKDEERKYDDLTVSTIATTYEEDATGEKLYAGDTLTVSTEDESKITAKVTALELSEDVTFTINGESCTWNEDVAGEDLTDYFAIAIDQEQNTVTIGATLQEALQKYAEKIAGVGAKIALGTLPVSDMFRLTVSVGDQSLNVDFSALSEGTKLTLDTENILFEP